MTRTLNHKLSREVDLMIQSIVHIALVVKDYDEAIAFYTKKLNFILVEDTYQPEQDRRWVVVSPPGSRDGLQGNRICERAQRTILWNSGGIQGFIRESLGFASAERRSPDHETDEVVY